LFRVRRLDDNLRDPQAVGGDMLFGRGSANIYPHNTDFLVDSPAAVAQCVLTRLRLWAGEWFLNRLEGTPYMQEILGHPYRTGIPDSAIRGRILGTPFVTYIEDYASSWNPTNRVFAVSCRVYTQFGVVTHAPAGAIMSPSGALVIPLQTSLSEAPPQAQQHVQPSTQPLPLQARYLPPR